MALLITEVFNEDCEVLVEANENGSKSHCQENLYEYHMSNSGFFEKNKYFFAYIKIVEKAKREIRDGNLGYYEKHHILPKSVFPEFSNLKINYWNGVVVTAREHFVLHKLLTKFTKESSSQFYKLLNAYAAMIISKKSVTTARQYEDCKRAFSKSMSFKRRGRSYVELYGAKKANEIIDKKRVIQSNISLGRTHSERSNAKNRESNIISRQNKSKDELENIANKISIANKGKQKPDGFGDKVSAFQRGRIKSEEEKRLLGEKSRGTVFINKDGKNTKIKSELLEDYLRMGWTKGMLINRKKELQ
jgi:hypothetical protein